MLGASIGLLNDINGSLQSLVNLWENIVYPVPLINQAQMMVTQLVAQFRGLVTAIDNVNVRSATLPNPIALEAIMRNASVADFGQFDQVFRTTSQALPPAANISPGDQQRVDMSDALAMDTLKALKASDQVVQQTLQGAQMIEDQAAPSTHPVRPPFSPAPVLAAAVQNQAMMQKLLAVAAARGGGHPRPRQRNSQAPGRYGGPVPPGHYKRCLSKETQMDQKWRLLHVLWEYRTRLLVLMLIVSLVAPQPARAQLGIDWGAIVAAIDRIGSAISKYNRSRAVDD